MYANVPEAMCFIDWSTKCVHGQDKDYYEMKGCANWAKEQYCQAKADGEKSNGLVSSVDIGQLPDLKLARTS